MLTTKLFLAMLMFGYYAQARPTTPVNCQVSSWSDWSTCDLATGTQTSTRTVTQQPQNGGSCNQPLTRTQSCPVNCQVSSWSDWSTCDPATGTQTSTRTVTQQPQNGGSVCPSLTQTRDCPVDCQVSDWSAWTLCVSGSQTSTRTVTQQQLNGGASCPSLTQTRDCPVNCQVSQWSSWGSCQNGVRTRTRTVTQQPANGGTPCPTLTDYTGCVGCGQYYQVVECVLDRTHTTTTCVLPGGDLKVVVRNKPGYSKALVRISAKPVTYSQFLNGPAPFQPGGTNGCGTDIAVVPCVLNLSQATTTCPLPGGVLTLEVKNKAGYKKAFVRVDAKPIGYA